MSLWIRSQEKALFNTITLDIIESCVDNNYEIQAETSYNTNYYLGTYKTKERAIQILDEIQELIKKTPSEENIVYQMPEE